jgi:hypothetical protein
MRAWKSAPAPVAPFRRGHALATALLGDAIARNMFTVGYAWQGGGLPISRTRSSKRSP